jgi:4-amino-4-deoxy-L-arabinose transferase and related glycosyltransferases of PMT family
MIDEKNNRGLHVSDLMVFIPILFLLLIQVPHLSLPYFWDEAWSYIVAVRKMAEAGPSLLPGAVPIDYCKGHPQVFYFLSGSWFNLFSGGIWSMRFFALIVSVGLLIAFYFGLRKISNQSIAAMGVVLLGVQSMFLAQSIMILPEMMLSLFLILAFFAFVRSNYLLFALWSAFMISTKETALIFAVVFVVCYFVFVSGKENKESFCFRNLFLIFIPIIAYLVFLVMHRWAFGSFFYGEHLGYINCQWDVVWKKLGSAFVTVFVHYGRLAITLFLIGSAIFLIWKKIEIRNKRALFALAMLIPAYLIFLSFNFYSPRYTLTLVVLAILVFALLLDSIQVSASVKWAFSIVTTLVCLFYSVNGKREIDIDLGYVEVVEVNRQIVKYCEENNFYDQPIAASFNMNFALKDNRLGFLSGEKNFGRVEGLDCYQQCKYVVFETTTGANPVVEWTKQHFILKKEFHNKHAFGFIYENPSFSPPTALAR